MKRFYLFALVATLFASCSTDATQDLAPEIPTSPDELYVSFDAEDTRIQLGENGSPVWTEGDLVSVFYKSNANQQWQFQGNTGDATGMLKRVNAGTATVAMEKVVAVYPYNENYLITPSSGNIEASLPAEQTYLADSYGLGSSLMVSSSEFNQLSFKNVCGWLKLQFTGSGYLSKIVLRGNSGEQVAGKIYVNSADASCVLASEMGSTEDDGIGGTGGNLVFDDAILTEVALNCGEGVALNSEIPTAFYIALPPQTFEKGITAIVYNTDGNQKEIFTKNTITIERNHILPMASVEIEIQPNNEIWYTSSDGKIVTPKNINGFGANIVSNTYKDGKGIIEFDNPVLTIPRSAFEQNQTLTTILLPNKVATIDIRAFYNCQKLTSINLGSAVEQINKEAFVRCGLIGEIVLPQSVWHLGKYAFMNCYYITSVTLSDSLTNVDQSPFLSCSKLEYFYGKFSSADNRCFIFNDALKSVSPNVSGEYYIPNNVTYLDYFCINYPQNPVTYIIPNSVTDIDESVATATNNVVRFNGKFASEDGRFLIKDTHISGYAPNGATEVVIPEGITSVSYRIFNRISTLEKVIIPSTMEIITLKFADHCTNLKQVICKAVTPPTFNTSYTTDAVIFEDMSAPAIYVPTASVNAYKAASYWSNYADAIEGYDFDTNSSLPTPPANEIWYTSSDGNIVEPYFDDEFGGATLLSNTYEEGKGIMKFNGNVTEVGYYAFYECKKLTSINIPNSVTSIGERAFYKCSALKSFYGKFASEDNRCLIIDGVLNYFAPAGLTTYTIPNSVTSIGIYAFYNCKALESVTIPNSVTSIGIYAFSNCSALESITIPNSVTSIGDYAFIGCSALKSVTIGNSVTLVGVQAFYGCSALTSITIPNSVTSIGWAAFYDCSALKSVIIPNSVTSIGERAFYNCSALKRVDITDLEAWCKISFGDYLANPLYYAGGDIYLNGKLLENVVIPESITELKYYVFCGAKCIKSVTIHNKVTSIGYFAFQGCSALKKVYCKPTTPPTGGNSMFSYNASGRKIYVPTESVDAYKAASDWKSYADSIEPYNFTE